MQIMLVCERHNLYDAIIYIHNTAILDYISPAERMLTGLSTYVKKFKKGKEIKGENCSENEVKGLRIVSCYVINLIVLRSL